MVPLLKFFFHEEVRSAAAQVSDGPAVVGGTCMAAVGIQLERVWPSRLRTPALHRCATPPCPLIASPAHLHVVAVVFLWLLHCHHPQAVPEMLRSASLAAAKGMGPDTAYVRNMLAFIWKPLMESIPKVRCAALLCAALRCATLRCTEFWPHSIGRHFHIAVCASQFATRLPRSLPAPAPAPAPALPPAAQEPDMEVRVCLLEAADEIMDVVEGPAMLALEPLSELYTALLAVLGKYEERRVERVERMKSEVGRAGGRWVGSGWVVGGG